MNTYLILKLVHILAVIAFMGNIVTGLFWMKQADKTKDIKLISFTMKGIIASDRLFTIPGVIIITAGGFAAAIHNNIPLLRTGWIFWPIILFTFSGIMYSVMLAPMQKKIYRLTLDAGAFNWSSYHSNLKKWEVAGFIAMLTPLVALVMMVLKLPLRSPVG
jgi:uncharacterized membrane protein